MVGFMIGYIAGGLSGIFCLCLAQGNKICRRERESYEETKRSDSISPDGR